MLRQHVADGHPDVLRTMIAAFVNALMSADADAICGAEYGQRFRDRSNRRNGYRACASGPACQTSARAAPPIQQV